MKTITNRAFVFVLMVQIIASSTGAVFAQSYDDFGGTFFSDAGGYSYSGFDPATPVDNFYSGNVSGGAGYNFVNFDPSTPVSYNDFNNTYFNDAATYYGTTNCVGCNTSSSYQGGAGYNFVNFDPSTPVSYNDFNNTYFNDAATYYGTTNCVGCDYVAPIYTAPTYVAPIYNYTTPTYTSPTYTAPTYNYTTPTYTAPTYNYTTPTYVTPTYTSVPTYTTTPTTVTTICSDGFAPVNGSCIRTNTIPTTTTTVCSDGFAPVNGTCVRTNTLPTVTNTICSDGRAPVNGSCIRTNTLPTTTTTVCSDGSTPHPLTGCNRTIFQPVTTTQVCWDGSTIPLSSVCPAQYKMCANGTSIPVHQTCYYAPTVPYTPPVTIKFNNVITSVTTEITTVSARCNGIGLIASNAPSTGWFEYGETTNLGRETGKANIGSAPTAPFSNKLVNLKPATTYYCRAVMQNQFGTVKGEIVAFKTKAVPVSYVKPVTKTTVTTAKTTVKKATVKSNEVLCVDGKVATVESKTAAQLINSGEKLVSLQIEKTSGNLSAGSQVDYRLSFKNLSDETLRSMTIKVVLPPEFTLTNAQAGQYDPTTRTLTITNPSLAAYGQGTVGWTGIVARDATVGKSLVTTAYSNYQVPGSDVQDEVTAYTVGSIVAGNDAGTTTGAKKVIGASSDRSFLPNSLVEWLALIAIFFIIFVLGRSVYSSYAADRKATH